MKTIKNTKIIGIDHGYGNMKTANHCFKTGISTYDSEPLFTADMLTFNGRYYLIGEGHKEFTPDKVKDDDYYVLTLAAIAKELKAEKEDYDDFFRATGYIENTQETGAVTSVLPVCDSDECCKA